MCVYVYPGLFLYGIVRFANGEASKPQTGTLGRPKIRNRGLATARLWNIFSVICNILLRPDPNLRFLDEHKPVRRNSKLRSLIITIGYSNTPIYQHKQDS